MAEMGFPVTVGNTTSYFLPARYRFELPNDMRKE